MQFSVVNVAIAASFGELKAAYEKTQITEGLKNGAIASPMTRCWMQKDTNDMLRQYCHDLVQGEDVYSEKTFTANGQIITASFAGEKAVQVKNSLKDKFSFDKFIAAPQKGENEVDMIDVSQRLTHEGAAAAAIVDRGDLNQRRGAIISVAGGQGTDVSVLTTVNKDFTEATILEVYAMLRPVRDSLCVSQLYRFPQRGAGTRRRFGRNIKRSTNAKENCKSFAAMEREAGNLTKVTDSVRVAKLNGSQEKGTAAIEFSFNGFSTLYNYVAKQVTVVRKRRNNRTFNARVQGKFAYVVRKEGEKMEAGDFKTLEGECASAETVVEIAQTQYGAMKAEKCSPSVARITVGSDVFITKSENGKVTGASNNKAATFLAEGASLLGFDASLKEQFTQAAKNVEAEKESVIATVDEAIPEISAPGASGNAAAFAAVFALLF